MKKKNIEKEINLSDTRTVDNPYGYSDSDLSIYGNKLNSHEDVVYTWGIVSS